MVKHHARTRKRAYQAKLAIPSGKRPMARPTKKVNSSVKRTKRVQAGGN